MINEVILKVYFYPKSFNKNKKHLIFLWFNKSNLRVYDQTKFYKKKNVAYILCQISLLDFMKLKNTS